MWAPRWDRRRGAHAPPHLPDGGSRATGSATTPTSTASGSITTSTSATNTGRAGQAGTPTGHRLVRCAHRDRAGGRPLPRRQRRAGDALPPGRAALARPHLPSRLGALLVADVLGLPGVDLWSPPDRDPRAALGRGLAGSGSARRADGARPLPGRAPAPNRAARRPAGPSEGAAGAAAGTARVPAAARDRNRRRSPRLVGGLSFGPRCFLDLSPFFMVAARLPGPDRGQFESLGRRPTWSLASRWSGRSPAPRGSPPG